VGLDASEAVRRAAALNRDQPNALIVQGDIFRPPLTRGFDFAYSVGVLHHTPDAHLAFLSTAQLVRPGGEMAVWLYPHARDPLRQSIEWCHERVLRRLTSRLPLRVLEKLCAVLGRVTVVKTRLAERGGAGREALARLLNLVAVGEHLDPQIAAFLNFDWYSPPYRSRHTEEELCAWYREAGFETPRLLPVRVSAIGRAGVAPPPS
jgi:SAM-dependent methyltransferase